MRALPLRPDRVETPAPDPAGVLARATRTMSDARRLIDEQAATIRRLRRQRAALVVLAALLYLL